MEKETIPQWLMDGAVYQFRKNSNYLSKINSYFLIGILAILSTGMYSSEISDRGKEVNPTKFFIEIVLIIVAIIILYYSILALIKQKDRQAAHDKRWQDMYLQSKIDEFAEYQKDFSFNIALIKEQAEIEINQLKTNYDSMREKAEQAKQLLAL